MRRSILTAIASIYDAASDESLWARALEHVAVAMQSQAASFCVIDNDDPLNMPTFINFNFDPVLIAEYLDHMVVFDPTVQAIVRHPEQKIYHESALISAAEKSRHPYFDWHHRKIHTRHRVAGMVTLPQNIQAGVTLHRTAAQGDFSTEDLTIFRLIYDHIERAVTIGFRLGTLGYLQKINEDLLDHNRHAIILLDAEGRVVFANDGARRLAVSGDGIILSGTNFALVRPKDNRKLQSLIGQTVALQQKRTHVPSPVLHALRPSGKRPFMIMALPFFQQKFNLMDRPPVVCIMITDPETVPEMPIDQLKSLYKLSPSEARLAALLATGNDLKDIADKLGVAYQTARTQLSSIFRKTQTHRQSELIRLLLTSLPLTFF